MRKSASADYFRENRVHRTRGAVIFSGVAYTITALLTIVVLLPMIYVVSASFSTGAAVTAGQVWLWPVDFTLYNYQAVLRYKTVWIGYRNTILYTVVGTAINIAVTMACAYPLARRNLVGRNFFTKLFTFTMIFSGGMIPGYLLMRDLHLMNTVWVMLIPGGIAGSFENRWVQRHAVFLPHSAAAFQGDSRRAGHLLRGGALEQLFQRVFVFE